MARDTTSQPWRREWRVDNPPSIGYAVERFESAVWETGASDFCNYRDLGLAKASNGTLGAKHIRVNRQVSDQSEWHAHDIDFQFLYVIKGSITVETATGESHILKTGDAAYHPRLFQHREGPISADYEVLEITAPAAMVTARATETANLGDALLEREGQSAFYLHDGPDAYVAGGLRGFFEYRDLETAKPTEGRVHIHYIRALDTPDGGTGWHHHTMGQIVFVLQGSVEISVDEETITLRQYDALCLGAGMAHNVSSFSSDYAVIEMCVPANYDTIALDGPPQR